MKNMNKMRFAAHAFGRGVRVMAAFDIGKARTRCQELQTSFAAARTQLAEHVQNGTGTEQELQALRDQIARETREYTDLMGALQNNEQQMASQVAAQFNRAFGERMNVFRDAVGGYFRAVMTGTALTASMMAALSVPVTTGANPGNGLLPVTVSDHLIADIYGDDGFLQAITVTNIPGLRLPKAKTTVTQTTEAVPAGTTATVHNTEDDTLMFGRFPGRDKIEIPTSVLRGTNTQLFEYAESKLMEIHRERMLMRMWATAASGSYAHMSVYDATVGVKEVEGATMYDAICAAIAELPTAARRTAKVAMTPLAYFAMVRDLANGAMSLFGKPQEAMLGFGVVLCDNATQPLVGDLKTIHVNYDDTLQIESDKDIDTGVTKIVISGDYDIQVEDANRLRRVKVAAATAAASSEGTDA